MSLGVYSDLCGPVNLMLEELFPSVGNSMNLVRCFLFRERESFGFSFFIRF